MSKKLSYLLLFLIILPLSYLLFTYLIQMYYYGLIIIFFLIFLQTPRPSKTTNEEELSRSRYLLVLATILTVAYGLGGFLALIF